MKRAKLGTKASGRALLLVIAASALALVACDNRVEFSPTPPVPPFPPIGDRELQIYGSLSASGGACLVATILFDGVELPGARADCPEPAGCADLKLAAATSATDGRHTISFLVLGQSPAAVAYRVDGRVVVMREGLWHGGATLHLEPRDVTLREGDRVTYEVVFQD